jgi:predicted nucleic acid-binding protein
VKWLFDTNVVSEGIRPRPARQVIEWSVSLAADEVAISVVTLAELLERAESATDVQVRAYLSDWIESEIRPAFRNRTLALSVEVLTDWLSLSRRLGARGRPQVAPDLLIAATARVHNLVIATRNAKDFAGTGVTLFDPWTGKTHRMAEA